MIGFVPKGSCWTTTSPEKPLVKKARQKAEKPQKPQLNEGPVHLPKYKRIWRFFQKGRPVRLPFLITITCHSQLDWESRGYHHFFWIPVFTGMTEAYLSDSKERHRCTPKGNGQAEGLRLRCTAKRGITRRVSFPTRLGIQRGYCGFPDFHSISNTQFAS